LKQTTEGSKSAGLTRQQRRELGRKIRSEKPGLDVVHPDAASIDIGSREHCVAVGLDRDSEPVRVFGCFTADLQRLAEFLTQCRIKTQSTGVYWIPVYDVLEQAGCEVWLVNARDTKNLPGRKSDVQESQWLLKLHTYGLLRKSFRRRPEIRALRTCWRERAEYVQQAGTCIQRMHQALTEMNVQIYKGVSGELFGELLVRLLRFELGNPLRDHLRGLVKGNGASFASVLDPTANIGDRYFFGYRNAPL